MPPVIGKEKDTDAIKASPFKGLAFLYNEVKSEFNDKNKQRKFIDIRSDRMRDQYNRRVNYMRISITDLCNLRCLYCMPEEGICKKDHKDMLTFEEITKAVKIAATLGIDKIRITGGEPLVKKGIVEFIKGLSDIKGIKDIAMTTNGVLLKKHAKDLKEAGLKRVNISIDSLKQDNYARITRGGDVHQVLEGIEEVIKLGMTPVKLNAVVIGGYNQDEVQDLANLTKNENIEVRFIELMPVGEAGNWAKERFISNEAIKEKIGNLIPLVHQASSPAKYYKLPDGKGKIGFINPISSHFCGECNRIRMTSDGKLKPCLHSHEEIDILNVIRNTPDDLKDVMANAIMAKPQQHYLYTDGYQLGKRSMAEIGG
ncbi:cyclic pyranopterin monophosphate synthase subunit MoaA [Natronincola peptidivorans]|uniref:GTP 3',8-cyclase n=1 Tax=Natronincola peptidivorans TaxID=426128 RepID=A0A1I0EQ08_9FIRM|nr:GTP 3',8-cyclase MoaA [Natronincola peptidivorans]SET47397.1 cyclic pyranopterin monophosphate synthase subunit MoaA [Natronincola peptidivorans]